MTVYPQNGYRNGTMYSSYTASSFAKIYDLADQYDINLLGILSWSFEFEDQPWFHGFRDLATNGVGKPVLNVFRMFGMMGNQRIEASSEAEFSWENTIKTGIRGEKPETGVLATKGNNEITVMIWNYHDDDKMSPDTPVEIMLKGIDGRKVKVTRYRIDRDHNNSYEVWKKMGCPQSPSPEQYEILEKAGKLSPAGTPERIKVRDGILNITSSLQRQGIELLKIER
jgi:xylan 1,4-beta-xylosidase